MSVTGPGPDWLTLRGGAIQLSRGAELKNLMHITYLTGQLKTHTATINEIIAQSREKLVKKMQVKLMHT